MAKNKVETKKPSKKLTALMLVLLGALLYFTLAQVHRLSVAPEASACYNHRDHAGVVAKVSDVDDDGVGYFYIDTSIYLPEDASLPYTRNRRSAKSFSLLYKKAENCNDYLLALDLASLKLRLKK